MNVDELVSYISEKTSLTYDQAKEAAGAAADWLKGMIPDEVAESFGEFFDSMGDMAGDAAGATMDAAKKGADMAGDAAGATGDAAKGMWDKAKDTVSDLMDGEDAN